MSWKLPSERFRLLGHYDVGNRASTKKLMLSSPVAWNEDGNPGSVGMLGTTLYRRSPGNPVVGSGLQRISGYNRSRKAKPVVALSADSRQCILARRWALCEVGASAWYPIVGRFTVLHRTALRRTAQHQPPSIQVWRRRARSSSLNRQSLGPSASCLDGKPVVLPH